MGEKIIFPLDSEAYLRKGRIFLREGKIEEAIECLNKAYELNDAIEINIFYVSILVNYQRYEEALEVMNREKSFYKNSESHASIYVEVLVKTQRYLAAEYIIQKYKDDATKTVDIVWEMLAQELIEERERFNSEVSARKEQIKISLRRLEGCSRMGQIRKVREAEILDLTDLQELAPAILVNANLDGTVQRSFLELLIQKGDQNTYSFLWFKQIKEVCPAALSEFDKIELVHQISEAMERKLAKYPDLEIRVKIEMMHDLLLLYPYIEETITDLDFWLDTYISELDFFNHISTKRVAVTEEQKEMMDWINYLNIISQRDQMFKDE